MCGICGIYNFKNSQPVPEPVIKKMNQALWHRGPDDEGYHFSGSMGMAMRRLSIIDLAGGHQPVYNENKTVCTVYNGEIYNYRELREQLEKKGHRFSTNSDTEVIVHLYEERGPDLVRELEGMFSLAVWDEQAKKLLLARDHFGIKPLYYSLTPNGVVFASEIRSLLESGLVSRELDYKVVDEYFSLYYTTAPGTMFRDIKKMVPAHYHVFSAGQHEVTKYWQLDYRSSGVKSIAEYEEGILDLLKKSVKKHLISDVPLGIFLSGGLDSTAILASMHAEVKEPIKSFSLGFADKTFDETAEIRNLVRRYSTDHHEIQVGASVMSEYLPKAIEHLGEPTGDWTAAMEYFLSEFSRKQVKVVLTGAGGDEIFAGYPTLTAYKLARQYEKLPRFLRQGVIEKIVRNLPVNMTNLSFDYKAKLFIRGSEFAPLRAHFSWKEIYTTAEKEQLYSPELRAAIKDPDGFSIFEYYDRDLPPDTDWINKLLYQDMRIFLGGCCLPHIDTSIMANSQEGRVPLLNHKLVEFAASIPPELKHHGLTTKYIFRRALAKILPAEIIKKKKMGFSAPMSRWIRDELSGFVREQVVENKAIARYFAADYLRKLVNDHQENRSDNGRKIAALVSFALWHRQYME